MVKTELRELSVIVAHRTGHPRMCIGFATWLYIASCTVQAVGYSVGEGYIRVIERSVGIQLPREAAAWHTAGYLNW